MNVVDERRTRPFRVEGASGGVGLYARVSTKDKKQDVKNQLAQLREFCGRQGFKVAGEYIDHESGKKGTLADIFSDR